MNRALAILGLTVATAAFASTGCNKDSGRPPLFSTDWVDDQGKSIGDVQARLRTARVSTGTDLAVFVVGPKADKIVGAPLSGKPSWSFDHALDARPVIAGGVVVGSGNGEVFALESGTGKKLWSRPTGGSGLLGASDDGTVTVLSFIRGTGGSVLVVGRDGSVKKQLESDKPVGEPAVVGGIAFVPWANQYVSAIDGATGDELGRVTLRDKVTRAIPEGNTLYFGELSLVRFDDKIGQASRGGANRLTLPPRDLPGTPRLLLPGTERVPPVANARDRARLFARPAGAVGPVTLDSNRFYASYFRIVFGFDASGALVWVHNHGSDVIGGDAIGGGLLLCDEEGKVTVLDAATGQVASTLSVNGPVQSCSARADEYRAPAATRAAAPLSSQIAEALGNREATLASAHHVLLTELAKLPDEGATKTLVDVASDPRSAAPLAAEARTALAARRNGAPFMLAALGRRYDFLRDVLVGPPVGALADALAAMKETRAAPLLAAHLLDPQTSEDDLRHVAAALSALATKDELPALRQFFAMYRGTVDSEPVSLAVGSVGEALLRVDPAASRNLLTAALKDGMTLPLAKTKLEAAIAVLDAEKATGKAPAKANAAAPPKESDKKPADKAAGATPTKK